MEDILDPELAICDAHHHLIDPKNHVLEVGEEHAYLLDDFLRDAGSGHRLVSSVYIDCGTGYRTTGPEQLRCVGETSYVVAQPASAGILGAIVGYADLRLGEQVGEVLDAHLDAGGARFAGTRFMAAWDEDAQYRIPINKPDRGVLRDPTLQRGAAELGKRNLTLDCWVYYHQLDDVVALAQQLPDQVLVLDHVGTPILAPPYQGRRRETLDAWRAALRRVAACPNVVLKIGGLNMHPVDVPWHGRATPVTSAEFAAHWGADVRYCIDTFTPARCLFESNFPVDKGNLDYATLWNAFKRITKDYTDSERADLFHGTATRTYRITAGG